MGHKGSRFSSSDVHNKNPKRAALGPSGRISIDFCLPTKGLATVREVRAEVKRLTSEATLKKRKEDFGKSS